MPKFPKPWLRKGRGWFATLSGKQIPLGREKDLAFAEYHRLMQQPRERTVANRRLIAVLIDEFLDWVHKHRSPETYVWYQSRLQQFVGRYPDLPVHQLKPFHVQQWIDSYALSSGSKRNLARSIVRCMNWCEEQGLIERTPLGHFKKPRGGRREQTISPAEYAAIKAVVRCRALKDLIVFAWETGARAAECLAVEKRHLDLENHRIVFPVSEEKMERAPRIIYLSSAVSCPTTSPNRLQKDGGSMGKMRIRPRPG